MKKVAAEATRLGLEGARFRKGHVVATSQRLLSSNLAIKVQEPIRSPETRITTLPSGLRVASEVRHGETATVGVWIDAGSRYETQKNNGAAHFLEHLTFKGTDRRTQTQLEVEIENMGAHLNAYTSREQTVYFAKVFKKDVRRAMDILSDILLKSQIDPRAVQRERNVILREMEEVNKQHEEVIMDHLHEAAYSTSGLGMTILGPVDNINSLKRQDLRDYIDTHYTAPRMVIAGAGAVDHEELVALSEEYWGSLPTESRTTYPTNFDPASFLGSDKRTPGPDDLDTAHVSLAFSGTSWTSDDSFPLMLIQSMLGAWDRLSGAGAKVPSALAQSLAERDLVHSFSTLNICYKDTGLFGIYIVGEQEKLPEALKVTVDQVQRLSGPGGVTEEDLNRAKTQLKANLMQQLGTFSYVCEDIGRQILTYGRRMPVVETFARIDAVTLEDVRGTASRFVGEQGGQAAFSALGKIDKLPDFGSIQTMLGKG